MKIFSFSLNNPFIDTESSIMPRLGDLLYESLAV